MGRGYSFQSFFYILILRQKDIILFKERGLGEREREMRKREVRELFINLSESSVWGHIRTPDSQYVKMRKKNHMYEKGGLFPAKIIFFV